MTTMMSFFFCIILVSEFLCYVHAQGFYATYPADFYGLASKSVVSRKIKKAGGLLYIGGHSDGAVGTDAVGGFDFFIRKYPNGYSTTDTPLWTKMFGTTGTDYLGDFAVDSNGNIFAVGMCSGTVNSVATKGSGDACVFKLDSSGAILCSGQYGGTGVDRFNGVALNETSGHFYATGNTTSASFDGTTTVGVASGIFYRFEMSNCAQAGGKYVQSAPSVAATMNFGGVVIRSTGEAVVGYLLYSTTATTSITIAGTSLSVGGNGVRVGFIKVSTASGSIVPDKLLYSSLGGTFSGAFVNDLEINAFDTIVMAPYLTGASTLLLQYKVNTAFSAVGASLNTGTSGISAQVIGAEVDDETGVIFTCGGYIQTTPGTSYTLGGITQTTPTSIITAYSGTTGINGQGSLVQASAGRIEDIVKVSAGRYIAMGTFNTPYQGVPSTGIVDMFTFAFNFTLPSVGPTKNPTRSPSKTPSRAPSETPTALPSSDESASPSVDPSAFPSEVPSCGPSQEPSMIPSADPSTAPSLVPTENPSVVPSTSPSVGPSAVPSEAPSAIPSGGPSEVPSVSPSVMPSALPSADPSAMPSGPSIAPSAAPSNAPSVSPSEVPSAQPSLAPSATPTEFPSVVPSADPSAAPSADPTMLPSAMPSVWPTVDPSVTPSAVPSAVPSEDPSASPSMNPTLVPSTAPSVWPTVDPSVTPSIVPSAVPSVDPTVSPSVVPSVNPSAAPSAIPTMTPSAAPSVRPTTDPSVDPSVVPSAAPSIDPSPAPSVIPTMTPSVVPSVWPTANPSADPSMMPSAAPSVTPTVLPSEITTMVPSAAPSVEPTVGPSATPSVIPSAVPSVNPTVSPSAVPTFLPTASPSAGPTARPTDATVRNLVLDVTQTVHNLDVATYNAQKVAFNVTFQQTIAATLEGITPEGVTDIEVTDKAATGRVWSNAGEVVPQCSLKYKLTMFDAQVEFDVFQAQLVEAVSTGMMDDHFRHYAGMHGIDNSSYFGEAQASLSGDRASSSALTGVMIAGIVIGVLLAISIGGFIVAFFLMQEKANRSAMESNAFAAV